MTGEGMCVCAFSLYVPAGLSAGWDNRSCDEECLYGTSLLIGLEERQTHPSNCAQGSVSCPCIPVKILSAPAFLMAA